MLFLTLLLVAAAQPSSDHWEPAIEGAVEVYNQGIQALSEGEPDAAERLFRKALRRDPNCGMCGHALALALLRQDRPLEAAEVASDLCERFPGYLEPALALAEADFTAERFDASIEVSELLLRTHPESWDSLRILVRGLLRVGDTARARAALQQATTHHGEDRIACELGKVAIEEGQVDEARSYLERCRLTGQGEATRALEARILAHEGRYDQAVDQLPADADPQLADLFQAHELIRVDDHEGAAAILRRSLEQHPQDAETAVLLGLCEYHLGRHEAAMVALELAFEGETWISVGSRGGLSGILTASGEQSFHRRMREGVARLVMLQAAADRSEDAQATLERARSELGPSGELAAAEVHLLCSQDRHGDAAIAAVRGLQRWPDCPCSSTRRATLAPTSPRRASRSSIARWPRRGSGARCTTARWISTTPATPRAAWRVWARPLPSTIPRWGCGWRCWPTPVLRPPPISALPRRGSSLRGELRAWTRSRGSTMPRCCSGMGGTTQPWRC